MIIQKNIFFRNGFEVDGTVDLMHAAIGGLLSCANGKFRNLGGMALNCEAIQVKHGVLFIEGFEAEGGVRLFKANIDGNLECFNGKFKNNNDYALDAALMKVSNNVFFSKNFEAEGIVNLRYSVIGGSLQCSDANFLNPNDIALNFENVKVANKLILENTVVNGFLNLAHANVNILNDHNYHYDKDNEKISINGLTYNFIEGNLSVNYRLLWLRRMSTNDNSNVFQPQPWKQLAKVLREMGHVDEADHIMIGFHYKRLENIKNNIKTARYFSKISLSIIYIFKWLFKHISSYGYQPIRAFTIMTVIWILCGFVYWYAARVAVFAPSNPLIFQDSNYSCKINSAITPTEYNNSNNWYFASPGEYTTFQPFWYSLDVILPVVDLQMEKDWGVYISSPEGRWSDLSIFKITFNHVIRWVVWIENLFGWILSLMLVAILSGLAKNEKE